MVNYVEYNVIRKPTLHIVKMSIWQLIAREPTDDNVNIGYTTSHYLSQC